MNQSTPPAARRRLEHLSTLALILALVIAGYVAFTTRPWDQSNDSGGPLGLLGGDVGAPRPGEEAPDFALLREDGSTLRLSELRGTPVFLNFWATWCTFCLEEMPDMQRIAEQFDGQVVVLGLNAGDSIEDGASFARSIGATYELVYDTEQEVVGGYRVRAMPTSYFLDGDGRIVDVHFGFLTYDDMLAKVTNLIEDGRDG